MLRPRSLGKIAIAVLIICCVLIAVLFAIEVSRDDLYKGARSITYAILALTFATLYRYLED